MAAHGSTISTNNDADDHLQDIIHRNVSNVDVPPNPISISLKLVSLDNANQLRQTKLKPTHWRNIDNHRFSHPTGSNNRRRQFNEDVEDDQPPRPFDHILHGSPPTEFQQQPIQQFPDIPQDYTGSVNSIRDILDQISDPDEHVIDENIDQIRQTDTLEAYVARNGRKIRFGGTYRQRKSDLGPMSYSAFGPYTTHTYKAPLSANTAAAADHPKIVKNIRDPFHAFKPHTMADINLLATRSLRFAPSAQHNPTSGHTFPVHDTIRLPRPRPIIDPAELYKQLIAANNLRAQKSQQTFLSSDEQINSRATTGTRKRPAKPFSLMLDVYPMFEDDHLVATSSPSGTVRPSKQRPLKQPGEQNQYNSLSHVVHHAINNLPLHMIDDQYFQNMQFPQVRPTRQSPIEYTSDEGVLHANQMPVYHPQPHEIRQPLHPQYNFHRFSATKVLPNNLHSENQPSTITVHLNLFPKNKNQQRRSSRVDKLASIANTTGMYFSGTQRTNRIVRPSPTIAWNPDFSNSPESSTFSTIYRENQPDNNENGKIMNSPKRFIAPYNNFYMNSTTNV